MKLVCSARKIGDCCTGMRHFGSNLADRKDVAGASERHLALLLVVIRVLMFGILSPEVRSVWPEL